MSKITLFHDVISPYSWVGFERITRYAHNSFKNTTLDIQPVFLSGIMQGSGNKPPGIVPAKMKFMGNDLKFINKFDAIPVNPIQNAPNKLFRKGSKEAQRFLTAMKLDGKDIEETARQFSIKMWSVDEDITDKNVLIEAAIRSGLSADQADNYMAKIDDAEVKSELMKVTKKALDLGCFGCPSFLVENAEGSKHFTFGSDRIELICQLTGEEYKGSLPQFSKC